MTRSAALALGLVLGVAASASAVDVVDDVGRRVTIAAPPQRIVSTAPSNTEALFVLGAGDRVVGVTTFCDHPEAAKSRVKVGGFSDLDIEKILALEPDLVVATWLEQKRHVDRLQELGLTVLVLFPKTLDETMQSLETLGRAIGAEGEARALVKTLHERLVAIDARVAQHLLSKKPPRVFVELNLSPLYTAGPGSTVHEAILRAGGANIASDLDKPYATISREAVVARDPEVILAGMVGEDATQALAKQQGLAGLAAVKSGRVFSLDPGLLFHQNHRLVDGIEQLVRLFHEPELAAAEPEPEPRP